MTRVRTAELVFYILWATVFVLFALYVRSWQPKNYLPNGNLPTRVRVRFGPIYGPPTPVRSRWPVDGLGFVR